MRLLVGNKDYLYFSDWNITLKFNSIAHVFSFNAKRELTDYILDYPECKIYDDNDDLLLTGTVFAPVLKTTPKPEFIRYTGYGLAGVLEDSKIPKSLYPLQFDNLSLAQITEKLLGPFNLGYNFLSNVAGDLDKKYTKLTIEPDTSVKQILNNLASQRNIFLTSNEFGEIFFTRYEPSKFLPSEYFVEGEPGLTDLALNINSQALHSEITVLKEASKDNPDAGEATINNPYIDVFRPNVKKLTSGDIFDVEQAARNALSAELANIRITFNTTRQVKQGETISLQAPSLKIKHATEFFAEQVVIKGTIKRTNSYSVTCVLTDVYTDNDVKNIFR